MKSIQKKHEITVIQAIGRASQGIQAVASELGQLLDGLDALGRQTDELRATLKAIAS